MAGVCPGPGILYRPGPVHPPQDKPRVERIVQYVRKNFFAGEEFVDLAEPRPVPKCGAPRKPGYVSTAPPAPSRRWCSPSGRRRRVARPVGAYPVPIYAEVKVARDYHVQIAKAFYSIPHHLRGQTISARADAEWPKSTTADSWSKLIPVNPPERSTDPADLPAEKTAYAMRDLTG